MTVEETKILIEGFESGTLPKNQWTHYAHFVMALWYTYHQPLHQARQSIKKGIKHYNESAGGKNTIDSGYHETITELYIRIIVCYQLSFGEATFANLLKNLSEQKFIDKAFPFTYYTKELLMSKEARMAWVNPDIAPLPSY